MQQMNAAGLKPAEYARNMHIAVAPSGASLEDALKPEFWSHVAAKTRRWDRIELRAEDDTWWADLLVTKAERLALHVSVIAKLDLSGASKGVVIEGLPKEYDVQWGGPAHKFRVIRKADNEILAHGMSKEEAIQWAIDDAKARAA